MKKRTPSKGFTLIELLVVIAIIGILASVILASLNSARAKGQDAARASDVKSLKTAMELYYNDNHGYPTSPNNGNGDVPLNDPVLISKLVPAYIPSMPDLLINDGDRYFALNATTGVSGGYDMLIYLSNGPCRGGNSPEYTGDWALPAVCNF